MFYADIHIHSKYSRATSKQADLQEYYRWARIKGISVISTSDFTHPAWMKVLRDELREDGTGLLTLKEDPVTDIDTAPLPVKFVLSTEISLIYKHAGKTRKTHHVVMVPTLDHAEALGAKLGAVGNVTSDGRPILGITSRELLGMVKDVSPDAHLIPAHVWTPWFSLFGAKSGYDDIEECFGDLTPEIFALETGLSSDPYMNWMWSGIDKYSLVSNSDAHSPAKLGREACVFGTEPDYYRMVAALKKEEPGYLGTVEFFPEEGKYHYDGHRKCGVVVNPADAPDGDGICPECGKPLTMGVMRRVVELADRAAPAKPADAPEFSYFVPLPEIIARVVGTAPTSKKVIARYRELIPRFGNEFNLVSNLPLEEIDAVDPFVGRAVRNIREGKVDAVSGYDGEFGIISALSDADLDEIGGQTGFFGRTTAKKRKIIPAARAKSGSVKADAVPKTFALTDEQREAVTSPARSIAVHAGPGSGKTRVLVERVRTLVEKGADPGTMLVLTFTNRAVDELKARLADVPGNGRLGVHTFHGFCRRLLDAGNAEPAALYYDAERDLALHRIFPDVTGAELRKIGDDIGMHGGANYSRETAQYRYFLSQHHARDIGLIVSECTGLMQSGRLTGGLMKYELLFVDEFQDINRAQYDLLLQFKRHASYFVIGDPDQAIYAWRGARPELFRTFTDETNALKLRLSLNFRSQPRIVDAANRLISIGNVDEPDMRSQGASGPDIECLAPAGAAEEARLVCRRIVKLVGGSQMHTSGDAAVSPDRIAVLYRGRTVAGRIQKTLADAGIPVEVRGEELAAHPAARFLGTVMALAGTDDWAQYLAAADALGLADSKEIRKLLRRNAAEQASTLDGVAILKCVADSLDGLDAAAMIDVVVEEYPDQFADYAGIVAHLKDAARPFGADAKGFLEHLAANPYAVTGSAKPQGVTLCTFHGAKGLEFDTVFIIGAVEGVTPSVYSDDADEERRLFYVAMTRAERLLVISSPKSVDARDPRITGKRSRFVDELSTVVKETKVERKARQLSLF